MMVLHGRERPGAAQRGVMMRAAVRVDVERHVRDETTRRLATLVPNPTTPEATEARRRGAVVGLGTLAEAIAELDRND